MVKLVQYEYEEEKIQKYRKVEIYYKQLNVIQREAKNRIQAYRSDEKIKSKNPQQRVNSRHCWDVRTDLTMVQFKIMRWKKCGKKVIFVQWELNFI